jgi:hypothetical protein
VRRNTGTDFGASPQANVDCSNGPFFGTRGTFFADLNRDGRVEAIAVNDDSGHGAT